MIHKSVILRLLLFPAILIGVVQLAFGGLSLWLFDDQVALQFLLPSGLVLLVSLSSMVVLPRLDVTRITPVDAAFFAVSTWIMMGFLGALPILLIAEVSVADSIFESVSALTTTGATILSGLDTMPKSFLLYRQFLQWLGGLGVVIFVVAVLPLLNVGGMKLLKAETPGPVKNDKVAPRTVNSAHSLWLIYLGLTSLCAGAYFMSGMSLYDAIAHSFTTVSTGGFSTHDASMAYFESTLILWVANVFMLLGAISFGLHYRVLVRFNFKKYFQDEEVQWFFSIIVVLVSIILFELLRLDAYDGFFEGLTQATFHLISFITSTGYGAGSFTEWPGHLTILLLVAGYIGGCAGSTAGGNKIIRFIVAAKLIVFEHSKALHPKGVFTIKYQGKSVDPAVISAVIAFLSLNAFLTLVLSLLLMGTGLDFYSAISAVAACVNVLGPAFGELGSNFQPVSDVGIWILSFAMILGRLEFLTVLALVLPLFSSD